MRGVLINRALKGTCYVLKSTLINNRFGSYPYSRYFEENNFL